LCGLWTRSNSIVIYTTTRPSCGSAVRFVKRRSNSSNARRAVPPRRILQQPSTVPDRTDTNTGPCAMSDQSVLDKSMRSVFGMFPLSLPHVVWSSSMLYFTVIGRSFVFQWEISRTEPRKKSSKKFSTKWDPSYRSGKREKLVTQRCWCTVHARAASPSTIRVAVCTGHGLCVSEFPFWK